MKELYEETSAVRDTLMLQFVHFEATAKRISELGARYSGHERILRNILLAAQLFLHKHMFTLQLLPRLEVLVSRARSKPDSAAPGGDKQGEDSLLKSFSLSRLPQVPQGIRQLFTPSYVLREEEPGPIDGDASVRPVVANLDALISKTEVLLEQQAQLKGFLQGALDEGQSEEAAVLQMAIAECNEEVRRLKAMMRVSDQ